MKRRKIIIRNTSRWATADLRRILRHAATLVFDAGTKPVIRVDVFRRTRKRWIGGCAYINGYTMTIRMPDVIEDPREVGAVIVHEMGHLRGLEHKDMRGGARWTFVGTSRDAWLAQHEWIRAFPLRHTPAAAKPARATGLQLVEKRRELAEAALVRWQAKGRRALNAIRKYKARIAYYQRRAAAMKGESKP